MTPNPFLPSIQLARAKAELAHERNPLRRLMRGMIWFAAGVVWGLVL